MDIDFPEFFLNLISQINSIENRKSGYVFSSKNNIVDSQGGISRIVFKRNSRYFMNKNKCLSLGSKSPCFGTFC